MWQQFVEIQRTIYEQIADLIRQFSVDGQWPALFGMVPIAILFGAVHALTPGHSKSVLAAYVAGSPIGVARTLATALTLSVTHVTVAVLIAVMSLPLVSLALGSAGRATELETVSRTLLMAVGVWMLWRAAVGHRHAGHEGEAVGFFAGLIPCPLTLFVMTFAISRGVPEAGLVFSVAMMCGVAITLSMVALLVAVLRIQVAGQLERYPHALQVGSRVVEAVAGVLLIAIAIGELFSSWRF